MNDAYLRLAALDVACLLAAAMMFRSWRKRQTRPALVAMGFLVGLAVVATILVLVGVPSGMVVGPTFIFALLVVMYTARLEKRFSSTRR
jgi:peptidoglycan/LPS O-acetylase OafA/YrhL